MLAYKKRKVALIQQFIVVFLLLVFLIQFDDLLLGTQEDTKDVTIQKVLKLPVKEISGFHLNRDDNEWSLDIVSDRDPILYQLHWKNIDGIPVKPELKTYPFDAFIQSRLGICSDVSNDACKKLSSFVLTQWEGVTRDKNGQVVLLQETTNSLYLFSHDMKKMNQVISFQFKDLKEKSRKSLGEGLVFMNDDHFLIAKEKYPAQIVEYGPQGSQAKGFGVGRGKLQTKEISKDTKSLPDKTLQPLAQWQITGTHSQCDFSELAQHETEGLYVLSQQCRKIFLVDLEMPLSSKNAGKIKVLKVWNLPAVISHPEALAVIDGDTFMVGSDSKKMGDNVFVLRSK